MPANWSADLGAKTITIRVTDVLEENACVALTRGVAMVTNIYGDFAIVVDAHGLRALPDYTALVRIAHEIAAQQSEQPARIAFSVAAENPAFGQCRQLVTLLGELDVRAEIFAGEQQAREWLEREAARSLAG